jgi:hypothetical protein
MTKSLLDLVDQLKKFFRYNSIYGFGRALFKAAGRLRGGPIFLLKPRKMFHRPDIGVIGNGQFAFSTLGYAIVKKFGNRFVDCFDISKENQLTFAEFFSIKAPSCSIEEFFSNENIEQVYVASNHATHAHYAMLALLNGKNVYVEKPLVTSYQQLKDLIAVKNNAPQSCRLYCGFNRPFSEAVTKLKELRSPSSGPVTLSMNVSGHSLSEQHWYRNSSEGSRICGNASHWIDLAIHVLSWESQPDQLKISITYSHPTLSDENISLSLLSPRGDLVNLVFTCRNEPFEGVYETLFFQDDLLNCTIEDFRSMTIWKGELVDRHSFSPKDAGHLTALLQPFSKTNSRSWRELIASNVLMLEIADMTENRETARTINIAEIIDSLDYLPGSATTAAGYS